MDILKLSEFKGFVIFDEADYFHIKEDVEYFDRILKSSGFVIR